MGRLYAGEIDAFPSYQSIHISLSPTDDIEEGESAYEVELPRDMKTLALFFNKLHSMIAPQVPCESYSNFARDILERHTGEFYTDQENIEQIIDRYRQDFTPEHEFPGGSSNTPDLMDFFISESITLTEDATVNGTYFSKGTILIFHHKGHFNG